MMKTDADVPRPPDRKFRKSERIYLKNDMQRLLREGKYIFAGGFKCCFRSRNGKNVNRLMISVPKKSFKRAVKRNLLKRRIREAYRMNKELLPVTEEGCDMLIIYMGKDVRQSEDIGNGVRELLSKLAEPVRGVEGRSKENGGASPDSLG